MPEDLKDDGKRLSDDGERFIADGVAAVKAEFAKLPHRTLPTYEDVVTAIEAAFRHMTAWRGAPPPAAEPGPAGPTLDVPDATAAGSGA